MQLVVCLTVSAILALDCHAESIGKVANSHGISGESVDSAAEDSFQIGT